MRTTIRLNDELLKRAKALATRTGRTLTALIEDALRETIDRSERTTGRSDKVVLHTSPGRLRPGVDLDDNAGLRELMDGGIS